jgi:hypothetical protein
MTTLFGDTSETLSDSQKGKHQVLIGTDEFDNLIFGDAGVSIIDSARGGNDTLTGAENASFGTGTINQLFGDTETMANFAKGGNDTLTGGATWAATPSATSFSAMRAGWTAPPGAATTGSSAASMPRIKCGVMDP